jgi:ferrochelatase
VRIDFTEGWADHPLLAEGFADRLRPLLKEMSAEAGHPVPVLFTAHSVPLRTVQPQEASEGQPRLWPGAGVDPYADDARGTAAQVAKRIEQMPKWWFAFQSQGASGGPWIGPSVEETLDAIAGEGVKELILQPIGFLCDHVEILFDVDILFNEYAKKSGIFLRRPSSLNTSPYLVSAVADLAGKGLDRLHGRTQV